MTMALEQRAEQSRAQRDRNRRTIKVSRIANGYLVHRGNSTEQEAALTRADVHRRLDNFFDQLESEIHGDEDGDRRAAC